MDYVDDINGKFYDLAELEIDDISKGLICESIKKFNPCKVRYFILERGLSSSCKVVAKPESLFPLLIKIDNKDLIEKELKGDKLLRYRVPPLSMPPFEDARFAENLGLLAYRYITGGRVKTKVKRFDDALIEIPTYTSLAIIDDIFDVVLKKCHWLDDQYKMEEIKFPKLENIPEISHDKNWQKIKTEYENYVSIHKGILAPHGVIHGDLHAKNILVSRNDAPILIDFSMAQSKACHYIDFAKLEINLQFQVHNKLAKKMWRIKKLIYSKDSLIIPHSNTKLSACIHKLRANLWQGCTRLSLKMNDNEIDCGYRGFLLYYLARFYSKKDNNPKNKDIAFSEFCELLGKNHNKC